MTTILKKTFFVLLLGSSVLLTAPAAFADGIITIVVIITTIIATPTLRVPLRTGTGIVSGGLTRSLEIPSARMDHIRSIRIGSALIVTIINLRLEKL